MAGSPRLGRAAALVCGLLCLLVVAPGAQAAEDLAAPLFQPYAIDVIDLQLPPASFETLEAEPEENYVEGTFSMAESDGTPGGLGPFSAPIAVGIRLKGGNGSFRELKDEKAAFKIKFNQVKGQKFLGLKKLTLNNMVQDPSMLHETMAYEAFRALGVPAPRTGYANVYVNGVNYGVHLDVETYDDISLPHLFATTQHLYEADTPGVDVTPGGAGAFEVDEGDEVDRADLEALIAAADNKVGDWSHGMAGIADLEEMTRMWAVERYAGHWDGYAGVDAAFRPNNYYLQSDESGLFSMLPWGTDQTWGLDVEFDEPAGGLLFNNCLADTSCKAMYVQALRELQGVVDGLDLGAQASCLSESLASWQAMEDADRREYDAEEIAEGVEATEDFIAARPDELADWLATQPAGGGEGTAASAPCGPPEPEPEPKPESSLPSGGGQSSAGPQVPVEQSPAFLRLLRLDVSGRELHARLQPTGPGLLVVTAKMPTRKGPHRVCAASLQVGQAGTFTLGCPLSKAARHRLRNRQLKLHVIAEFALAPARSKPSRRISRYPRPAVAARKPAAACGNSRTDRGRTGAAWRLTLGMREEGAKSDLVIAKIAARQHGVVATSQLLDAGIGKDGILRRLRSGRLHRIHRGVYAVGHLSLPREARWMAAILASGCVGTKADAGSGKTILGYWRAALSHRSAAELWAILSAAEGPVHISVPGTGGKKRRSGIRVHRSQSLRSSSVTLRSGIPVTTPARTISDLRRVSSGRSQSISPKELRRAIRQANFLGLPIGEEERHDRNRSDLEEDFQTLCWRYGLTAPEVNVRVGPHLVDFLWRNRSLVVETDGYVSHRGRVAFEDDRGRDLDLRARGYEVIRLAEKQVNEEPARVAEVVGAALRVRADAV
jgi:hypothetical protein